MISERSNIKPRSFRSPEATHLQSITPKGLFTATALQAFFESSAAGMGGCLGILLALLALGCSHLKLGLLQEIFRNPSKAVGELRRAQLQSTGLQDTAWQLL